MIPSHFPVTATRPSERWGQLALRGRTGRVTGNGRGWVQWRVMVEVSGAVGAKQVHEVHAGGSATPGDFSPANAA